jgi:disulfide bond formation protein DsbB
MPIWAGETMADAGVTNFDKARWVALLLPAALLAGALGSQYLGGLHPCEMCHWQRWPHYAAVGLALLSFAVRGPSLVRLAGAAIALSGLIGVYHSGVELGILEGLTQCSSAVRTTSGADLLAEIMSAPVIRCDQVQWTFAGISMAGWNAIISGSGALLILWLTLARPRTALA